MRVLNRVLHIRQRIIRQELTCLRQLGSFGVQEDFECGQFSLQIPLVLARFRQSWINGKVDVNVELQFLALEVVGSESDGHKSIPRDEEVLPLSQIEGVEHVADARVLVEQHVLLHALVLCADQLLLQGVHGAHHAILEKVLEHGRVDVLLGGGEMIKVQLRLRLRADAARQRSLRATTSKARAPSSLDVPPAL